MRKISTLLLLAASLISISFTSNAQCTFTTTAPAGAPGVSNMFNSNAEGFTGNFEYQSGSQSLFTTAGAGVRTITTPVYSLSASQSSIIVRLSLDRSASNSITAYSVSATTASTTYPLCSNQTLSPAISPNSAATYYLTIPVPANTLAANTGFQLDINLTQTGSFRVDNFGTNASFVGGALPINFVGLEAKASGSGTTLTWKVDLEENAKGYEVEKSLDGRSFSTIGFVPVAGLSTYSFVDVKSAPIAYYRIKGVDVDGTSRYSSVVSIKNGSSAVVLKAFPMPAAKTLTVQHSNATTTSLLHLFTESGSLVKSVRPGFNAQQTVLDLSSVTPGLYLVRFDDGKGNSETLKVIKQ
jgi:hypothetical protein